MAKLLAQRIHGGDRLVISGPVGTKLPDYGVETPAPLYSANGLLTEESRAAVAGIQRHYRAAGADIIPTATFGLRSTPVLEAAGISPKRAQQLVTYAAEIARRAAGKGGYVVGVGGSIEDCYAPEGELNSSVLAGAQAQHARRLRNAGVSEVWYETVPTGREARHAVSAAQEEGLIVAGMNFYVQSRPDGGVELPSGETLDEALAEIRGFDILTYGVNCVTDEAALAQPIACSNTVAPLLRIQMG